MPRRARPTLRSAQRLLKDVFGLDELRPGQAEIIASVLEARDTLAIMPTGDGRSLCYEIPALLLPGATIVVSSAVSSTTDQASTELVRTTPERFATAEFRQTLQRTAIDLVVVVDAHCVSQWSPDFRPAYLEIKDAVDALGRPPVLALSAIATREVTEDILDRLGIAKAHIVNTSVYRPNLQLEVWRTVNEPQKRQHLARTLQGIEGAGIVYAATVRQVDLLHGLLSGLGFRAAKYHGRMPAKQRHESQEQFISGEVHAMVATDAFGMGIDKLDIRFVIHYAMPGSLDAYYQEAGRAGRDGKPARCGLFSQIEDRRTELYFPGGRYPASDEIRAVYAVLARAHGAAAPATVHAVRETAGVAEAKVRLVLQLLKDLGVAKEHRGARLSLLKPNLAAEVLDDLAMRYRERHAADHEKLNRMMEYGQSARCRWKLLLEYFGEPADWEQCSTCDNCRRPLEDRMTQPDERSHAADR